MRLHPSRCVLRWASAAIVVSAALTVSSVSAISSAAASTAAPVTTAAGRTISPNTRFFVPPPSSGAPQQIATLLKGHHLKDAALIAEMAAIPRAAWFNGGTPAQVQNQVGHTMAEAAIEHAVPVLVAYDIPGRDCAQYSAGGALDESAYEAWIDGFAQGIGDGKAVVILEPDALGNMPSNCGLPSSVYPFTDAERIAEIRYAVSALAADPGVSVYLDGTHSAWQSVGTMTQRLLEADVQDAQGFFLNVSNYQPTPNLIDYGTWISDCIAMVTDPSNSLYGSPSGCASQYYPATASDFSTWNLTTQWYAANMNGAVATTHFVIDTSRNGDGPNSMQQYANPPYNQPASVIAALASGNWCNPPDSGLGLKPTANTGVPLLDAYLWVKTPGQSDGQCDSAGGVRAWNYSAYTQPGWPADAADQALFDPLWGVDDPAAGTWFPQEALQLVQDANPSFAVTERGARTGARAAPGARPASGRPVFARNHVMPRRTVVLAAITASAPARPARRAVAAANGSGRRPRAAGEQRVGRDRVHRRRLPRHRHGADLPSQESPGTARLKEWRPEHGTGGEGRSSLRGAVGRNR
jgi:endoglucanase